MKKIIFFTFYILIILITFILYFIKSYRIFPNYKNFIISDYNDENSKVVNFKKTRKEVLIQYELSELTEHPYAGVYINYKTDMGFKQDLYTHIKAKVKSNHENMNIRIDLKYFHPNHTNINDPLSYQLYSAEIPITNRYQAYHYPINKFFIPKWWIELYPEFKHQSREQKYLYGIEFANGQNQSSDQINQIQIKSVVLENNILTLLFYVFLVILSLSLLFLFFIFFFNYKIIYSEYLFPFLQKHIQLSNIRDVEVKKLITFINENYMNSDLSIEFINRHIGFSQNKISKIISKHYKLSFKEYLNSLRISEAKRLLLETDRQITEIAYETGYNSSTHFGRIFKQLESISPKEFRKKHASP